MAEKDREHGKPSHGTSSDRSDSESGRPVQLDHERPEKERGAGPGQQIPEPRH